MGNQTCAHQLIVYFHVVSVHPNTSSHFNTQTFCGRMSESLQVHPHPAFRSLLSHFAGVSFHDLLLFSCSCNDLTNNYASSHICAPLTCSVSFLIPQWMEGNEGESFKGNRWQTWGSITAAVAASQQVIPFLRR